MEAFSKVQSGYNYAPNVLKTDNTVSNPTVRQSTQISPDSQEKTESNGLTKALMGLAVLGAGIAGVAIYMKTKKKPPVDPGDLKNISQGAADTASDIQKNIKKFFSDSGDEITGKVNLKGGKALLEDGSGFSGTLKTVNKKGNEISIGYKDGFMTHSSIDGKEFKRFENLESRPNVLGNPVIKYRRDEGVLIKKFDEYGNIQEEISHVYDKNGRVSRVYKNHANEWGTAVDFADGKVIAKTEFGKEGIKKAEIFDKDGRVVKEIKGNPSAGTHSAVDILPDGSKKERIGYLEYDRVATPAAQYDSKMRPIGVINYDSNGKMGNALELFDDGGRHTLQFTYADDSIYSIIIPKKKKLEEGDILLPRFDFIPSDTDNAYHARINASGKNTHPGRFSDEQLISLQKHAREVIGRAKAEGIDFPYERAEEYLSKIFDV